MNMGNIIALIKSLGGGGGASVQSDWNQNDSTAADYIKNRPFYVGDPVETEIIPVTTVTFSEMDGVMAATWPESFDLVEGQTYKISWDGTDYVCTGILFNGVAPALGNLGIAGMGDDTGEPFVFMKQGQWLVGSTESATEHIIGIKTVTIPIVTLDEKYLPKASEDGYGIIKTSDVVSAYNFPAQAPHDQMVDAIAAFKTGNASIVWCGQKVINAFYYSSSDKISVTFADEPMKNVTFSNNNGLYVITHGTSTYAELQAEQVRIFNSEGTYTVLTTEGEQSNTTLHINADKFSINGDIKGYALVLSSSTANSTKKFKITVDDTGTLSTTEVT